jgi:hypothetical protein
LRLAERGGGLALGRLRALALVGLGAMHSLGSRHPSLSGADRLIELLALRLSGGLGTCSRLGYCPVCGGRLQLAGRLRLLCPPRHPSGGFERSPEPEADELPLALQPSAGHVGGRVRIGHGGVQRLADALEHGRGRVRGQPTRRLHHL